MRIKNNIKLCTVRNVFPNGFGDISIHVFNCNFFLLFYLNSKLNHIQADCSEFSDLKEKPLMQKGIQNQLTISK